MKFDVEQLPDDPEKLKSILIQMQEHLNEEQLKYQNCTAPLKL